MSAVRDRIIAFVTASPAATLEQVAIAAGVSVQTAREVLAQVQRAKLEVRGAIQQWRGEQWRAQRERSSRPPDHEGDEELLERMGRLRSGWSAW